MKDGENIYYLHFLGHSIYCQFQEFADALREFTGDRDGATSAEETAGELEDIKRRLEQERKQQEAKMQKEQQGTSRNGVFLS